MAGAPGPRGPIKFLSEEEKKNAPKVTKELMLRILSYLRPYWLQLLLVLAAIVLAATVRPFDQAPEAPSVCSIAET